MVPCYNEELVLPETTRRLLHLAGDLAGGGVETCILYVDDGSVDNTWTLVQQYAEAHQEVCGLRLAHNSGHQHALWAGLSYAAEKCDAVVSIDADLQDDVTAISRMVEQYRSGAEIVFGVRESRTTDSFFKRNTAQLFYRLMRSLGGDVVYNHADFRLMSKRAVSALMQFPERNLFLRGLVKSLGFRQAVVTYDRAERYAGSSKYPLRRMIAFAWDGITSFSVRPLRIILGLGLLCIVIAVAVIVWAVVVHAEGHTLPGWTSLLVSVWFVGGVILTSLGIMGEYIGKIFSEVKRRPRYIIADRVGKMPE